MSKETLKHSRRNSIGALCGAVGLAACCVLGGGFAGDGAISRGALLYGQEQAENAPELDPIVYFSMPIGIDSAPILASPSHESYKTGTLPRGDEVEIYFRNADGFCAIRPPQGSFSWINAKFVDEANPSTGIVRSASQKAVPSRVGGPSPASSSIVQVGLKDGQKIKLYGQKTLEDGSAWYQIAPPRGEFRWIHESSLVPTGAIAHLPSKLTSRTEYYEHFNELRDGNSESSKELRGLAGAPIQSLDFHDHARPENLADLNATASAYDQQTFQRKLARLRTDASLTFQKSAPTNDELSSLQARAEDLFDHAPSDDERRVVQTIFDAVAKTQIRMQNGGSRSNYPTLPPNVMVANNPYADARYMEGVPPQARFAQGQLYAPEIQNNQYLADDPYLTDMVFDEQGQVIEGLRVVDGQIVGTPTTIDGQYVMGATIVDDGSERGSKQRLGFAFSSSNNPFRRSTKNADGTGSKSRISRMESSLTHLPGFARNPGPTPIVPPQNYTFAPNGKAAKSSVSSKLTPGPLRSELAQRNDQPSPTQQGALVFQDPRVAVDARQTNSTKATAAPQTNWQAVTNETQTPEQSTILPTSAEESQDESSRIRPASAFAPIVSRSFDVADFSGTLVELSAVADGAPRYALLSKEDDAFNVVAYLDPGKNVSFDKFVGQKVVVKGAAGSVTVDGKTRRHIVVSSLYLHK